MSGLQKIIVLGVVVLVLGGGYLLLNSDIYNEKQGDGQNAQNQLITGEMVKAIDGLNIIPISHASLVLEWEESILYIDSVGGVSAFEGQPEPDIVLVTDIHGDHFDAETLRGILVEKSILIVPQAVADQLPSDIPGERIILANGETTTKDPFGITAIPMYNLPEEEDSFHTKGRGNGYIVENNEKRVYIAGDTEDIPEMRSLRDIDIAFVPMNLPFTMTVESAADAVLEFQPKQVYPYHYRGKEGLSDVGKFKELVNEGNPDIEVVQLNWYPEAQ